MAEINKEKPLVSVIIPFYSGKKWLIEALDSVKHQTYSEIEIILLNDGSKENIDDILNDTSISQYHYHKNIGAAATRNKGISCANGKYIAFLDSDDIWINTKIEIQVDILEKTNGIWIHSSYTLFDDLTGKVLKEVESGKFEGDIYPRCFYSCPIATPTVVIRRDILIESNMSFDESLKYGEDTSFWIQIAQSYSLIGISESLVEVRMHGSNAALDIGIQILARSMFLETIKYKISRPIPISAILIYKYCKFINLIINYNCIPKLLKYIAFLPAWVAFKMFYKLYK